MDRDCESWIVDWSPGCVLWTNNLIIISDYVKKIVDSADFLRPWAMPMDCVLCPALWSDDCVDD